MKCSAGVVALIAAVLLAGFLHKQSLSPSFSGEKSTPRPVAALLTERPLRSLSCVNFSEVNLQFTVLCCEQDTPALARNRHPLRLDWAVALMYQRNLLRMQQTSTST